VVPAGNWAIRGLPWLLLLQAVQETRDGGLHLIQRRLAVVRPGDEKRALAQGAEEQVMSSVSVPKISS
jgi:hypothetical protein